jgi:DNA primase
MAQIDAVKEKILEQADIADVVSHYVRLQPKGGRLFGLCPFHTEKTPSFSVAPEKGFYHCFGCGQGGNVIDFIMGVENLTYVEARALLAQQLNIPLEAPSGFKRPH